MNWCRTFLFVLFPSLFMMREALPQSRVSKVDRNAIETQVRSFHGPMYELESVINIDSAVVNPVLGRGPYEDPYDQLSGCLVFTAGSVSQDIDYTQRWLLGVYKSGQIIWRSDTLELVPSWTGGGNISATKDLNNDGKVDIMVSWFHGMQQTVEERWIFSWDGKAGLLISALNSKDESPIVSFAGMFDFADLDADGVSEIQGEVYKHDSEEKESVTYSWNGQLYGKWPTEPKPLPNGYLPRNKFEANVKSSIKKTPAGFSYRYRVENKSVSQQKIDEFLMPTKTKSYQHALSPREWEFAPRRKSLVGWKIFPFLSNFLNPGVSDSSFMFESTGLPSVALSYLRGKNHPVSPPSFDEEVWYRDIVSNSIVRIILAPADPPTPFVPSVFVDSIASYKHQALSVGWISNQGIANSLDQKLDNAKKQLEKKDNKAAKNMLEAFVKEVEAQKDKHLSSESYALLKFNAEYLISKITQ